MKFAFAVAVVSALSFSCSAENNSNESGSETTKLEPFGINGAVKINPPFGAIVMRTCTSDPRARRFYQEWLGPQKKSVQADYFQVLRYENGKPVPFGPIYKIGDFDWWAEIKPGSTPSTFRVSGVTCKVSDWCKPCGQ